jgi:Zn-dependent peptidase ImmA (M78 family)
MMPDFNSQATWPMAVATYCQQTGITLPTPVQRGMGSVEWRNHAGNRFITCRPSFKTLVNRETATTRWMLWHAEHDPAVPALGIRLPLRSNPELTSRLVELIDGWLSHEWSEDLAKRHTSVFSDVEVPDLEPMPVINHYELSEQNGGFRVTIDANGWRIQSGRNRLTAWKSKRDDRRSDSLPLDQLDKLCGWLARNWDAVAYGKHPRPLSLRDRRGVSACRAYESAFRESQPDARGELESWWQRHAFRAADPELPNIFLERQGDEVVFSWDDSPSSEHSFQFFPGMESAAARFVVPSIRQLISRRFERVEVEPKFKKRVTQLTPEEGFRAARSTIDHVTDQWLVDRRFNTEDALELARTGTALHPVVGLLRSAQGSRLSPDDVVSVLDTLRPNDGSRFQKLRAIAKNMDSHIDLREPWESGYHLARQVRAELGLQETGYFDVETTVRDLGIEVSDVSLTDPGILAVCVGSPQYAPLISINLACQDAEGPSGRRITLAHELCHLLFDRTRMKGFARFEGGAAESDRLIEMRANAFAVELLAPLDSFKKPDETWMSEEEAIALSATLEVSKVAISRHLQNRKRPTHENI